MAGVLQGAKACTSEVSSGRKRSLEVSVVAYTLRSPRLTTPQQDHTPISEEMTAVTKRRVGFFHSMKY